ncbi:MAG TPA: GspE/PulE family protein [Patescibacteria group bacterium]|nr:GspE/PulE family protein [Patescibacteria group bacterium]
MISNKKIYSILTTQKILENAQLDPLFKEAEKNSASLTESIINRKLLSEEALYQALAEGIGIPYTNLQDKTIRQDILFLIPEPIARTHDIIAFDQTDKGLFIATTDPDNIQTFDFLEKHLNTRLIIHLTSPSVLQTTQNQYHSNIETAFDDITKTEPENNEEGNKKSLQELAQDVPVIRIVNTLLEYAIFENASDIHIEPLEKETVVRYRIDGILRQVMSLPKQAHSGICARIKILANLKLDEHRLPQDGRFKIETKEYKISFRVSTIPVYDGEKIVMRLLNEDNQRLHLTDLGLNSTQFEIVQRNIQKPHGMILVTGPTGSGKTTTLYAMLNTLNKPEVNISTIEDPIEYRMEHINQSQTNAKIGFSFAAGLRALLRQDPDIIMVGEIRDRETAEIAVTSAMTGHLLLSTLHTNEAAATLPRLIDMGVEPFLISSTTNVIIAQRLVRKICQHCITSYNVDEETMKQLEQRFNMPELMRALAQHGAILSDKEEFSSLLFYRGTGCKKCHESGYRGRIGIYEILEITDPIKKLILQRAPTEDVRKISIEQNMLTLLQNGFIKAKAGVTTIEEVLRVSKE